MRGHAKRRATLATMRPIPTRRPPLPFETPRPPSHTVTRLDSDSILRALAETPPTRAYAIQVVERTGSTNTDLLERARAGDHELVARLARLQEGGRGRRERRWLGAPDDSFALSIGTPLPRPAQGLAGLSLAMGVAVAEALASMGARVALKWPNDVVLPRAGVLAKLAGILVETVAIDGGTYVVVGVGVNLRGAAALSAATGRAVADLASLVPDPDPNPLAARLIVHVDAALLRFARQGFGPFRAAFEAADALRGERAAIVDGGRVTVSGRVRGVDEDGALLLETGEGLQHIVAGELSLRLEGSEHDALSPHR